MNHFQLVLRLALVSDSCNLLILSCLSIFTDDVCNHPTIWILVQMVVSFIGLVLLLFHNYPKMQLVIETHRMISIFFALLLWVYVTIIPYSCRDTWNNATMTMFVIPISLGIVNLWIVWIHAMMKNLPESSLLLTVDVQ